MLWTLYRGKMSQALKEGSKHCHSVLHYLQLIHCLEWWPLTAEVKKSAWYNVANWDGHWSVNWVNLRTLWAACIPTLSARDEVDLCHCLHWAELCYFICSWDCLFLEKKTNVEQTKSQICFGPRYSPCCSWRYLCRLSNLLVSDFSPSGTLDLADPSFLVYSFLLAHCLSGLQNLPGPSDPDPLIFWFILIKAQCKSPPCPLLFQDHRPVEKFS